MYVVIAGKGMHASGTQAGAMQQVLNLYACRLASVFLLQAAETTGILAEGGTLRVSRAGAHKDAHQVRSYCLLCTETVRRVNIARRPA